MTKRYAELIARCGEDFDYELTVHEGYSGKFMYGAKTWAVSGDPVEVYVACGLAGINPKAMEDWRVDELGKGIILY